jgi:pilus assembly protein CpaF
MSSLADRLDQARQVRGAFGEGPSTVNTNHGRRRGADPFAEVKDRVHQALLTSLGPRLYDPHLSESELAAQVRSTLQEVIESEQTPLSHGDRTKIAQDVSDDI